MRRRPKSGFTLLEMLLVMSVIVALGALVINASSGAQQLALRRKAEAEVRALETAVEQYRHDNGQVPQINSTEGSPFSEPNAGSASYATAAQFLFDALVPIDGKAYMPNRVNDPNSTREMILDPWGKPYGYNSATNLTANPHYPGVSIWSTAGESSSRTNKWITNWN
jgi:prepilin-type N-terminal cleavage/methylation domain-containing protein